MTDVKRCSTCRYNNEGLSSYPCSGCVGFDRWTDPIMTATQTTNTPITAGVKYDKDKPKWSLLPFKALAEVVDVLTYGARKYAPDNWKKVPDARNRYIDATFRHFTAYISGEKNDSETGLNHLAHAICCLLFLLAFDKGEHHDESINGN